MKRLIIALTLSQFGFSEPAVVITKSEVEKEVQKYCTTIKARNSHEFEICEDSFHQGMMFGVKKMADFVYMPK